MPTLVIAVVMVFVIVFVIVLVIEFVIALWDWIHLRSLLPYSCSTFILCARMRTGTL